MSESKSTTPYRVLLVEDDLDQAHLVKFLLEDDDGRYAVTLAQDGLRGSLLVRDSHWDLVITDLNLPGADGMAVVEASREHQPGTPILATTGHTEPEYGERALHVGANAVLLKPLDKDDLLKRVRELIEGPVESEEEDSPETGRPQSGSSSPLEDRIPAEGSPMGRPDDSTPSTPPEPSRVPSLVEGSPDASSYQVLALSVRPGDAEAGIGGILLRHAELGHRVVLVTLTHGSEGDMGEVRKEQAKTSGRMLGAHFFVGKVGEGDRPIEEELWRLVRGALEQVDPDLIYVPTSHHPQESHRIVHETAVGEKDDRPLFAYDPGDATPGFAPDRFVVVDPLLDRKLKVVAAHDEAYGAHLSPDQVQLNGRFWGRNTAGSFAEALEAIRGELPEGLEGPPFSPAGPSR